MIPLDQFRIWLSVLLSMGNPGLAWDPVPEADIYRVYWGDTLVREVETTNTRVFLPYGISELTVTAVRDGLESPRSEKLVVNVIAPAMVAEDLVLQGSIDLMEWHDLPHWHDLPNSGHRFFRVKRQKHFKFLRPSILQYHP